jgi:DNA-binding transcriptional LysR family regulator
MNITFRQMRLFLALAETGSVSGAARVMHVTQPTASMQLREITQSVGMPLYELISRRIHLTQAGEELARTARSMVTEWEAFGQKVDRLKGLTRGRLRLAVVSTAQYFIPRLLGSFCRRHPDIEVALQVLNRDGVLGRMRENQDDLYIMSQPPGDIELEDRVFMSNPLVVIAPLTHRLAGRRQIALRELRSERFILRESGSGTRMAVDQHFKSARFSPLVRLELGSNEAIREAVAAGLGLSVLSSHALGASTAHARGVTTLQVQGFPLPSQWHLVWQKGKRPTPVALAFSDHLLKPARRKQTDR